MDEFSQVTVAVWSMVIVTLCVFYFKRRPNGKVPPSCSGWIPWLGCAVQFGQDPLCFIEQKRKELGPLFTLEVAGEKLTFLTQPEDYHHFFDSSNVDFQLGVYDSVVRVASIDKASFFAYHTSLHDLVKGKLAPSKLGQISSHLCKQFNIQINEAFKDGDQVELLDTVRHSMYAAVLNNLFGQDVLPISDKDKFERLKNEFIVYDDQFEMGAKLPAFFLRRWSAAKSHLLDVFRNILRDMKLPSSGNQTLLEAMVSQMDQNCAPNYGMITMWAVLANAIPITFWTLAYILSNPEITNKLQQQLKAVYKDKDEGEIIDMTEDDIRKVPYLKWCALEAIRLHPVGVITRRVIQEFTIKDYTITKGTMLMVSPFWAHRNEKFFPEPEVFRPERWEDSNIEKGVFLEGFVAFGGGRYQCPGRWFALLEIQMYIALFLLKFDTTVHSNMPKPSMKHVVGTQHSLSPFMVTCNKRNK